MQYACVVLSSVAYVRFSALSHIRHDFRGGGEGIDHKMSVLFFPTNFCCYKIFLSMKN